MNRPIRIAIVDDHELFREPLAEFLQAVDGFDVVGQGGTGDDAITLAREIAPDVLLLDISMPGTDTGQVIDRIGDDSPTTNVIIVTAFADPSRARQLVAAGARGYLLKNDPPSEVIAAIRLAASPHNMVLLPRPALTRAPGDSPSEIVSSRERQVLELMADGKTNREIARALGVADATVKRHASNMYAKLGVTSQPMV